MKYFFRKPVCYGKKATTLDEFYNKIGAICRNKIPERSIFAYRADLQISF